MFLAQQFAAGSAWSPLTKRKPPKKNRPQSVISVIYGPESSRVQKKKHQDCIHSCGKYCRVADNGNSTPPVVHNLSTYSNMARQLSGSSYGETEGCCDCALCRCLRRVPYGTLFAALLVAGGLALLCYETLIVRDTVKDMFKGTAVDFSNSEQTIFTDGYDILFWVLIALVCVMGLFAILLLIFACFSTGSSGRNTCGKHNARCVGRFSTSLMIIASYGVSLIWLVTIVVMSMAFTFMMMVRAYCMGSLPDPPPKSQCLDLAQYGLVTRSGAAPTMASNSTICGDRLKEFCDSNDEIHLCVYLIMVACLVIVIGMIHFLMSLAANHTYLKIFANRDPPRTKYGNDYRRTYTGNDYPGLQEPLNMSDETTRF